MLLLGTYTKWQISKTPPAHECSLQAEICTEKTKLNSEVCKRMHHEHTVLENLLPVLRGAEGLNRHV